MSRFAPKITSTQDIQPDSYEHGYHSSTDSYKVISKPGLSRRTVEEISHHKSEPDWMRRLRLQAYDIFLQKPTPIWGGNLGTIDFDSIHYYLKPTDKESKTWADVPPDIKTTFDRLGIPEAERAVLAGVKAQFDSEVIYGSIKKMLTKQGVIFISMDEALVKFPDLVRQYFGTIIPAGDNKFSALNTAVWSGGSFVYVPKGVDVKLPLQAYFRINAPQAGQFERTLIIAEEGSRVHYVEGCFIAGTPVTTLKGQVFIEDIKKSDHVLTHQGKYQSVYHTQVRPYTGSLYSLKIRGNPAETIKSTQEHPFLIVRRQLPNERNYLWKQEWIPVHQIKPNDYVCLPIDQTVDDPTSINLTILEGKGKRGFQPVMVTIPFTPELFVSSATT
jgi:Fe-S cluster assembly protein SufB